MTAIVVKGMEKVRNKRDVLLEKLHKVKYTLFMMCMFFCSSTVSVRADELSDKFSSFQGVVETFITGIGVLITLYGFFEWGVSQQTQEGGSLAQAFKRIAGGFIMILAPTLLSLVV